MEFTLHFEYLNTTDRIRTAMNKFCKSNKLDNIAISNTESLEYTAHVIEVLAKSGYQSSDIARAFDTDHVRLYQAYYNAKMYHAEPKIKKDFEIFGMDVLATRFLMLEMLSGLTSTMILDDRSRSHYQSLLVRVAMWIMDRLGYPHVTIMQAVNMSYNSAYNIIKRTHNDIFVEKNEQVIELANIMTEQILDYGMVR